MAEIPTAWVDKLDLAEAQEALALIEELEVALQRDRDIKAELKRRLPIVRVALEEAAASGLESGRKALLVWDGAVGE